MQSRLLLFPLMLVALTASGCDFIGDVIEFGLWLGIIIIGLIALLVYMIFRWIRRR